MRLLTWLRTLLFRLPDSYHEWQEERALENLAVLAEDVRWATEYENEQLEET